MPKYFNKVTNMGAYLFKSSIDVLNIKDHTNLFMTSKNVNNAERTGSARIKPTFVEENDHKSTCTQPRISRSFYGY